MHDTGNTQDGQDLVSPGCPLVSVTDPQGRITFCNAAFAQASGYRRDELLGQPHHVVRHPDMPAAMFSDLRALVRHGQVWTGAVKNRRKDGAAYWVRAHVSPILDGERLLGYLWVRTPISPQDVERAHAVHQALAAAAARVRPPP